jgi:hypothetical protein
VAIFHVSMHKVSRGEGRSVVACAAYRSGQDLICEREGRAHTYGWRSIQGQVGQTFLFLPSGETTDRQQFWNSIEAHHKRGDAILAREIEMSLPHELTHEQRAQIVHDYAVELSVRYGVGVDASIHMPCEGELNHHVHILLSGCVVDHNGKLGNKANELDPIWCKRNRVENPAERERVRWQDIANGALEAAGFEERIDHRSLAAQGIERQPQVHRGVGADEMERDGIESSAGAVNLAIAQAIDDLPTINAEIAEIDREIAELDARLVMLFEAMRLEEAELTQMRESSKQRMDDAYPDPFSMIPTPPPTKKPVKPPEPEVRPAENPPVAANQSEADKITAALALISRQYGGDWQAAAKGMMGLPKPRPTQQPKPPIVTDTPRPATDRNLVRELLAIAQKGDMKVVYEAAKNGFDVTQIDRYQEKSTSKGRREIVERWGQLITDPDYVSLRFEEKLVGMLDAYYQLAPMPEQGDELPMPEPKTQKDDWEPSTP